MTRHNNIWQHKERCYGIWAECVILCYKIWYGVVRHNLISYFLHKKKVICDMTLYDMSSYYSLRNETLNTMTRYYSLAGSVVWQYMARYGKIWLFTTEFHSLWPDMVWYDRVWAKKVEYDLLLYTLSWKNSLCQYMSVSVAAYDRSWQGMTRIYFNWQGTKWNYGVCQHMSYLRMIW